MNAAQYDALIEQLRRWPEGEEELQQLQQTMTTERPGVAWLAGLDRSAWSHGTGPEGEDFDEDRDMLTLRVPALTRGAPGGDAFSSFDAWEAYVLHELAELRAKARTLDFPFEELPPRGTPLQRKKGVPLHWRQWMLAGRLLGYSDAYIAERFSFVAGLGTISRIGVRNHIHALGAKLQVPQDLIDLPRRA